MTGLSSGISGSTSFYFLGFEGQIKAEDNRPLGGLLMGFRQHVNRLTEVGVVL